MKSFQQAVCQIQYKKLPPVFIKTVLWFPKYQLPAIAYKCNSQLTADPSSQPTNTAFPLTPNADDDLPLLTISSIY